MKQFDFDTCIGPGGIVAMPPDMADQVSAGQSVKVVVTVVDDDEEREWVRASAEHFLQGYAASDDIYDQLTQG